MGRLQRLERLPEQVRALGPVQALGQVVLHSVVLLPPLLLLLPLALVMPPLALPLPQLQQVLVPEPRKHLSQIQVLNTTENSLESQQFYSTLF